MATTAGLTEAVLYDALVNYLVSMARAVESAMNRALDAIIGFDNPRTAGLPGEVFLLEPRINEMDAWASNSPCQLRLSRCELREVRLGYHWKAEVYRRCVRNPLRAQHRSESAVGHADREAVGDLDDRVLHRSPGLRGHRLVPRARRAVLHRPREQA